MMVRLCAAGSMTGLRPLRPNETGGACQRPIGWGVKCWGTASLWITPRTTRSFGSRAPPPVSRAVWPDGLSKLRPVLSNATRRVGVGAAQAVAIRRATVAAWIASATGFGRTSQRGGRVGQPGGDPPEPAARRAARRARPSPADSASRAALPPFRPPRARPGRGRTAWPRPLDHPSSPRPSVGKHRGCGGSPPRPYRRR
jgi:hypothetical protein